MSRLRPSRIPIDRGTHPIRPDLTDQADDLTAPPVPWTGPGRGPSIRSAEPLPATPARSPGRVRVVPPGDVRRFVGGVLGRGATTAAKAIGHHGLIIPCTYPQRGLSTGSSATIAPGLDGQRGGRPALFSRVSVIPLRTELAPRQMTGKKPPKNKWPARGLCLINLKRRSGSWSIDGQPMVPLRTKRARVAIPSSLEIGLPMLID